MATILSQCVNESKVSCMFYVSMDLLVCNKMFSYTTGCDIAVNKIDMIKLAITFHTLTSQSTVPIMHCVTINSSHNALRDNQQFP